MSRIRVDELIDWGNSGPTLAVEGLRIPANKNLYVDGSIVAGGDTGLPDQVLRRTTTGVTWSNVPLQDTNTTYALSVLDSSTNPVTDKIIRLSAGGSGSGTDDIVLVAGTNIALTRSNDRIVIDSSYVDTDTITRVGANGSGYSDGNINFVGTGSATVVQSGRTISINVTDNDTTYTGVGGVNINSANEIRIGQPVGVTDSVTFDSITVTGNLVVQGTTTSSNVVNVSSVNKQIILNDVLIPTDTVATGGGVVLKGDTDHEILWSDPNDAWETTENWNLDLGKEYRINNSKVIDSTSLGSSVVDSNLTSVGIIGAGIWRGSTVEIQHGGTGATTPNGALNNLLPAQAGNANKYLKTDGQDTSWEAIPPTYANWTIADQSVQTDVNSSDIVRFLGTGSANVTLDNTLKRVVIDATNTTYNLSVQNNANTSKKNIRLTDSGSNFEEVVLAAGTGLTISSSGNEITISSTSTTNTSPTFQNLTVTGTVDASSFDGDGSNLTDLTGASNGIYGSSTEVPVITVDTTGRITTISTVSVQQPTTGGGGGGTGTPIVNAGGSQGDIQFNANQSFAGNSKLNFEVNSGELSLDGFLTADNVVSDAATIENLSVTGYLRLPNKNQNEIDVLTVNNGALVFNTTESQVELYRNGNWEVIGLAGLSDLTDTNIGSPSQGQVLSWNSAQQRWIPQSITLTGGGGISYNDLSVQTNQAAWPSALAYDQNVGRFTFTPPLIAVNQQPAITNGTGTLSITDGTLNYTPPDLSGFLVDGSTNLSDLNDVGGPSPQAGQALIWNANGATWEAGTVSNSLVQLSDFQYRVDPNNPGQYLPLGDDDIITYNSSTQKFEPTPAATPVSSLNDLSDVQILVTPQDNQSLVYDGTQQKWVPEDVTIDLSTTNADALQDIAYGSNGPQSGQVLVWSGTEWQPGTLGGGGGGITALAGRTTHSATSVNLAPGTYDNTLNIPAAKSYMLISVQVNAAAWVRLYSSDAARTADINRSVGSDPAPGSGVIAEVLTTQAATQILTPFTLGGNTESPVSNVIYLTVENMDTVNNQQITTTLTLLKLED